ncbi:Protein of unknown function DUF559, partial [Klenkia terrae]
VSRPPRPAPALGSRPFRGSAAVAAGTLTRHQLAGPGWVRVFPDVYIAAGVPLTHELRVRAALVLFPDAVVCGRSAARLWGVDVDGPTGDPDRADVEVARPRRAPDADGIRRPAGQQRIAGLVVRRRAVFAQDVGRRDGVRLTLPTVTALDLAAELRHDDAVVVLDQFCQLGPREHRTVTLADLEDRAGTRTGRGCRRIRAALADADGLAESPQETRTRLVLHRSALPRPMAQHRVRDARGREVARVDFAWPALRVALEYDGEVHLTRLGPDRQRMNRLQAAGWRVLYVTAADLHHPERIVALVAAALASSSAD